MTEGTASNFVHEFKGPPPVFEEIERGFGFFDRKYIANRVLHMGLSSWMTVKLT